MRKIALVGLVSCAGIFADAGKDFSYQAITQYYFPQTTLDARSVAMGGANQFTSLASNLVVSNPANTGLMKDAHASVSYGYDTITLDGDGLEEELNAHRVGTYLSLPIGPYVDALPDYGNFTIGWRGDWAEFDESGQENTHHTFTAGYAKAINDTFSLGYAISWHRAEVDDVDLKNDVLRHSFGALFKAADKTHVGIAGHYSHSTDEEIFSGGGSELDITSWGVALGVEHTYDFGLTTAAAVDYTNYDLDLDDGKAYNLRVGAEYPLGDWVTVRAGYRYFAGSDFDTFFGSDANVKFNAVSGGLGVNFGNWGSLNYGVEYRHIGDGDFFHTVSYDVPFSICE